jgi:hypothetical protein
MQSEERIPITIGIVGHLDAIITEEHERKIVELFDDLHANFPNSPLYLFSQLAKGADTAIANLFIQTKQKTKRAYQLIAPLPYDKDKYEAHFDEPSKQVFNHLLSQSRKSFVLNRYDEQHLDHLYREGGRFVADSSIILLAIVEKDAVNKTGGTADLVNYKTNGTFNADDVDGLFDMRGLVLELDCARASSKTKRNPILASEPLLSVIKNSDNTSILKALQKIDDLNSIVPHPLQSKSEMELYPEVKGLHNEQLLLRRFYGITNTGAERHHRFSNWVLGSLFIIGPVTVGFFDLYKDHNFAPVLLIITSLLIGLAIAIFYYNDEKKHHSKFLENRILSEALRIQFFWSIGGINENISSYILRIHNTEYNWIKYLLSAIYGVCYTSDIPPTPTNNIVRHWINDQFAFFENRINLLNKKLNSYKHLSRATLWPGVLIIIPLFLICYLKNEGKEKEEWLKGLTIAMGLLISAAASFKAYSEKKGFHQIINQYELMKSIYSKSAHKIEHIMSMTTSPEEKNLAIKKIYLLAGKEALIENGNWYLIFKEKEPEVQIGG